MTTINLLVTLNEKYLAPLKTVLTSIKLNNKQQKLHIWLIHQSISDKQLNLLNRFINHLGWQLTTKKVEHDWIQTKIATIHNYPPEMYFRLLAGEILPNSVKKVIYLDPDVLVINSIKPLWDWPLNNDMMAAASHTGLVDVVTPINNLRLNTEGKYYNTGVLLMNLDKMRQIVEPKAIQQLIESHREMLVLPDQDVLNYLYGKHITEIPEEIWNYDARKFNTYQMRSLGENNLQWIMKHTAILHFAGSPKPWEVKSDSRFTALYLQYENWAENIAAKLAIK